MNFMQENTCYLFLVFVCFCLFHWFTKPEYLEWAREVEFSLISLYLKLMQIIKSLENVKKQKYKIQTSGRNKLKVSKGFSSQSGAKGILKLRFKYRISAFLNHLLHFSLLWGRHYQASISTILQPGSFQKPYFISDISKGLSKGIQNRR